MINHSQQWTDEQVNYLISNHGKMSNKEIAKVMGRRACSIKAKLAKLRRDGKIAVSKSKVKLPETLCFDCTKASPLKCIKFMADLSDAREREIALHGKEYVSKVERGTGVELISITYCPEFERGVLV